MSNNYGARDHDKRGTSMTIPTSRGEWGRGGGGMEKGERVKGKRGVAEWVKGGGGKG